MEHPVVVKGWVHDVKDERVLHYRALRWVVDEGFVNIPAPVGCDAPVQLQGIWYLDPSKKQYLDFTYCKVCEEFHAADAPLTSGDDNHEA